MPQYRPWSSLILVVCGLMAVVSLGSIAAATDVTIADASPELFFVDTSPAFTWKIFADSDSFDVGNVTAGTTPFRIRSAAPDLSLVVDSDGQLGLGTESPVANLHIETPGFGAGIRMSSAGLVTPQAWELQADDSSFRLKDVTNGPVIPFAVAAGAPSNCLIVRDDGHVGIGNGNPDAFFHVKKPAEVSTAEIVARFEVSDDAVGSLVVSNASAGNGLFIPKIVARSASQNAALINEALITNDVGASPAIAYNAARGAGGALVTRPLVVYRNNGVAKATIAANGDVTATSFNPVSSRALKHDIKDLDSQKASDALRQLTPVQFVYNDDESEEERVGFIAEDVPELVANKDRQTVPIMDVVALVTKVVKDQQQTIDEQRKVNDEQRKTIDLLMKRLEALESQAFAR